MDKTDPTRYYQSYLYIGYFWAVIVLIMFLLTSCYGTYYISDAEYSDVRESHASVTYYDNQIYWGWHSGYYYYYGKPHYYPWYYYYNACPPSHYANTTHIVINKPVNKPTHRPNWNKPTYKPNNNKGNVTIKPNRNTKVNVTKNRNTKVSVNKNRKSINRRKPR